MMDSAHFYQLQLQLALAWVGYTDASPPWLNGDAMLLRYLPHGLLFPSYIGSMNGIPLIILCIVD